MGVNRRPVQRMHKLRDDVRDNVPNRERIEKRDAVLNDSPAAFALARGKKLRNESDLGRDALNQKLEIAWEVDADVERFDFSGGGDFGLRVTIPSTSLQDARGMVAGAEFMILEQGSALERQRFEAVDEANSGDVAAGEIRIVDATTWRLPDDAGWSDELGVRIRVEINAGARL